MANIKSAKKRVITSQKREEHNQGIRSAVKTSVKKVESLVEAGDKEAASKALLDATSTIDKAASKGILHKNNASRKVSRLRKAVNSIE